MEILGNGIDATANMEYNTSHMKTRGTGCLAAVILAAAGGCRLLETGYGDDTMSRGSADAVSSVTGAARSSIAWAGAKVLSFDTDLDSDQHRCFIVIGEHSAAAYKSHPGLPSGYVPLPRVRFDALALPEGRYRYDPETGFVEDTTGVGFGARLSMREDGPKFVVSFRGSNASGEDEHWMQDWIVNSQQGGGGTPSQYAYGAELLSSLRRAFPGDDIMVTGHSLGGGIAAYSTLSLDSREKVSCATYNAAGLSSISLLSLPKEVVADAASRIVNIRSKGDPVSAIPGTSLVGAIYEVDNLRFANHSIDGLLTDMRRRAEGRRAGWLRDLFDD